ATGQRSQNISQKICGFQRELIPRAAGRSQGTAGVDPDVLDARNLNHVQLLQNPQRARNLNAEAVLSASNVQ
ncbi:hypothetical protein KI387_025922, partial [Taxus chinensis]